MSKILPLVLLPDQLLRQIATPVSVFDEKLDEFVQQMFATMYHNAGIGLAAVQVGVLKRVVVIDVDQNPLVLINPVINHQEGEDSVEEGCLSIPGVRANVKRFAMVDVTAQNLKGEFFNLKADGLLAICIQHEIDHLNGVLFIDHLSKLKRERLVAKYLKSKHQPHEN